MRRQTALLALTSFIASEKEMIERTLAGLEDLHSHHPGVCTGHELRAEASYIHDFYNSAENIFRQVAEQLNGGIPRGESWHKLLLLEMKNPVPDERQAVISEALFSKLDLLLKFRHLFRNSYGVLLDPAKTRELALTSFEVKKQLYAELDRFLNTLS